MRSISAPDMAKKILSHFFKTFNDNNIDLAEVLKLQRTIVREGVCQLHYSSKVVAAPAMIELNVQNKLDNLKIDVDALDNYAKNISLTHPGFDECLIPVKNILGLFFMRKFEQFIEVNKTMESFYQVKFESLCKFLMRYKNLKKSSDMKGKITEAEILTIIKKLKEIK